MPISIPPHWLRTWSCALQLTEPGNLPPAPGLRGNVLRQIVPTSAPGTTLRVRLSNTYGDTDLVLRAVELARSDGLDRIDPLSRRQLRFSAQPSVTLAPGATIDCDPLEFPLLAMSRVSITIQFGDVPEQLTGHPGSRTTSFIATGDSIGQPNLEHAVPVEHWYGIEAIDVARDQPGRAIVCLGDSLTDGRGSTTNAQDRWPDRLSERLRSSPATADLAVLNLGLGGNAVLEGGLGPCVLERFERDVLAQPGVAFLILLVGVNDIGAGSEVHTVADRLIAAYERMIHDAKRHGIRVFGAPILPFAGSQYTGTHQQAARQIVNQWIRSSGRFDAVIDLDQAVCDPDEPERLRSIYDTGDHLHLSPAGYQRLADVVDLALFR